MPAFQSTALLLTLVWLGLVVARFHRSTAILAGGLAIIGLYTLGSLASGWVTLASLGLGSGHPWLETAGWALAGLAVTLAYSPLADRLASREFNQPPRLGAFKAIQRSWIHLVVGILVVWLLGGILEELVARGIVLISIETFLALRLPTPVAAAIAILVAGAGAGLMHLYQGPRAAVIIAQLSCLFGLLFVLSGHNLWSVILCHGLYDTIAFIRFARGQSRYAKAG